MNEYFKTAIDASNVNDFIYFDDEKQTIVAKIGDHGNVVIVCDKQNKRWMQRPDVIRKATEVELNPPKKEEVKEDEKKVEKPASPKFRSDLPVNNTPAQSAKTKGKTKSKPDSKPIKLF